MGAEPARVWVIDLDAHGDEIADAGGAVAAVAAGTEHGAARLDARERARAAALRDPTASRRYVAAHVALRILISQASGTAPGDVRLEYEACTACGGDHGRPVAVGGPHFSLSRSGRWAAIALSHERAIGIDLEVRQAPSRIEPLCDRLLAPGEHSDDLLRTWVRKEAIVKATGEGLNRALSSVLPSSWQVHDLDLPDGLVGAIAGVEEFTVESRASTRVRQPTSARPLPESAV